MSGGSMDYLYSKILHCADFSLDTPEREAFAKHLKLVAQALHDIEWVDSGDYGPGDENAAIRACLRPEQLKVEPLTDEEILSVLKLAPPEPSLWPHLKDEAVGDVQRAVLAIARAVERAYRIGGQDDNANS